MRLSLKRGGPSKCCFRIITKSSLSQTIIFLNINIIDIIRFIILCCLGCYIHCWIKVHFLLVITTSVLVTHGQISSWGKTGESPIYMLQPRSSGWGHPKKTGVFVHSGSRKQVCLPQTALKQEEISSLCVLRSYRQSWQHLQCPMTFRLLELSLVRSVQLGEKAREACATWRHSQEEPCGEVRLQKCLSLPSARPTAFEELKATGNTPRARLGANARSRFPKRKKSHETSHVVLSTHWEAWHFANMWSLFCCECVHTYTHI